MTSYLKTYFDQHAFPAGSDVDILLAAAFESYFSSLSLLGHPDKGARLIDRLRAAGADEAACLIDFGVDAPSILEALPASIFCGNAARAVSLYVAKSLETRPELFVRDAQCFVSRKDFLAT